MTALQNSIEFTRYKERSRWSSKVKAVREDVAVDEIQGVKSVEMVFQQQGSVQHGSVAIVYKKDSL